MSILERMRSGSDSTFMQVVMAMIIVAFVGSYAFTPGDRSSVVATVNGVKIMNTQLNRSYRNALREAERTRQRTLSDAEQKQLWESVRQSLIEREVLLQEAHSIGLEVSYAEVARQLLNIPIFRDKDGEFDEKAYRNWLKRSQYTKDDFEQSMHDDLLRAKLQQLVYTGASMSEPAMRDAYTEAETRVDLTIARIRPSAFEKDVVITDEERAKWLSENGTLVQETYDADLARLYDHPAQVRLRMIRLAVLPDGPQLSDLVPRINALRDQISTGTDMAELARLWSEDPSAAQGGDLGLRPIAQLAAEEADKIKDLKVGDLSRAVITDRDVRLLKVEERLEPKVDTLDDVKDSIADRLIRAERIPVLAAQFADEKLLPAWREGGAVPEDLLAGYGFSARPTGPIPTNAKGNPFAPPQALLDAARSAEVGAVMGEVFEDAGVYYVAQLTDRTEPDMEKFEQEKDTIRESLLINRRDEFYQAWVADLKSRASIQ